MPKFVFLDTSGWIALYNKRDSFYQEAQDLNKELIDGNYYYLTTNFILDETYTGLLFKAGHSISVDLGERIRNTETVKIIYITKDIEDRSWELFKKYSDKDFSFTDCTSFIILQDLMKKIKRKKENIIKIFSGNHHFKQMGYEILLQNE